MDENQAADQAADKRGPVSQQKTATRVQRRTEDEKDFPEDHSSDDDDRMDQLLQVQEEGGREPGDTFIRLQRHKTEQ